MKQWLETREVLDRLAELRRVGQRAALANVVRVRGSAYRHEGAKLVVAEDGSTAGNVSGGCLEQDVREVALQVIRKGELFFFQAEDGIRDLTVTGVQTCALPI